MRSSDFERLGDWQRKQDMTFKQALKNIERRKEERSSIIYTDRTTLTKKEKQRGQFPHDLMIKSVLNARNYSEKLIISDPDTEYFSNGKSTINIENGIRCFYKFEEFFENKDVQSKGFFLSEDLGVTSMSGDMYHIMDEDYKGSEYYRQVFLHNNQAVTISFIVKKTHYKRGWECFYPVYTLSLEITNYDLENNAFAKTYPNQIDDIAKPDSYLAKTCPCDYKHTIEITNDAYGNVNEVWDSSFYKGSAIGYQQQIESSLKEAYKLVEKLLDIKLEKKETLLKRLFHQTK